MTNKLRMVIFTLIILICIFTVSFVVYYSFFSGTINEPVYLDREESKELNIEIIENMFENLFKNKLDNQGQEVDITGITKLNSNEDLVYTWASNKRSIDNKYELNLNIPRVNISNTSVEKFNNSIKEIYVEKANEIIINANKNNTNNAIKNTVNNTGSDISNNISNSITDIQIGSTTIYTVEYASYINENILSLVIKSTLKEGNSPQRVMIQTYNYNLSKNEEMSFDQIMEIKGLDVKTINNAIRNKVESASKRTESLANSGYNVYKRDLTSSIYDAKNIKNYILGPDNHLYVIYAYGNTNFTDEIDVIAFI